MEYWRDYEGEEVLIRSHTLRRTEKNRDTGPKSSKIKETVRIIQGTVSDVMSFPAGFRLTDVREYVYTRDYSEVHSMGSLEYELRIANIGENEVRRVDEKFVSFDSIEELEWADNAEEATNPLIDEYRESQED
jgi:hypothetical protein